MSTFSQPEYCSITLNDTTLDTITIVGAGGSGDYSYYTGSGTSSTISVGAVGAGGGTYSITGGLTAQQINSISTISIGEYVSPKEFVDCMPDFNRIEKMCEEYPGLKIAFEKFKTTYYLVKDDYDTPKDKRVKP